MRGIICLNCESEWPPEDRYCGTCGRLLPIICLSCDAENPWQLASCRGCGANLLSQELADEEIEEAFKYSWLQNYLNPADMVVVD